MMLTTNGGGIDDYFRAISGLKLPQDSERLTEISNYYSYFYLPPAQ
jgi:Zn-finger domain-containing protein